MENAQHVGHDQNKKPSNEHVKSPVTLELEVRQSNPNALTQPTANRVLSRCSSSTEGFLFAGLNILALRVVYPNGTSMFAKSRLV